MSVRYFSNGIVSVLFNTESRWKEYTISELNGEVELRIYDEDGLLEEYKEIVELKDSCVRYHMQEKDQVEVLFIPVDRLLEWEDE